MCHRQEHDETAARTRFLRQKRKPPRTKPHASACNERSQCPMTSQTMHCAQLNTRTLSSTTNREGMCSLYVVHTRPQQYIVTVFRFPKKACKSPLNQIHKESINYPRRRHTNDEADHHFNVLTWQDPSFQWVHHKFFSNLVEKK